MKAIKNGLIYHNGTFLEDHVLVYDDKVVGIYPVDSCPHNNLDMTDADGHYVLPGFIDVHIHGYHGHDVMDGTVEAINKIRDGVVENGVTSFLATTMTMSKEDIIKAMEAVRNSIQSHNKGADIVGIHMEGPFINIEAKGAQAGEFVVRPADDVIRQFEDLIKIVTIAPEVPGAMDLIKTYKDKVNFSLGHSKATHDQACSAYHAGAKSTTHLFNAMTGLHHRDPGLVGAALTNDCYCELIADGIHVQPSLFPLVTKAKGVDKVLLITDCMKGGGLPDGRYDLGGQLVDVIEGKCTLEDGTIAGSVLKLNAGLRNYVKAMGEDLVNYLPVVTLNQAQYLKLEDSKGTLDVGKDADIVIMNKDYTVNKTIVKGTIRYEI